MSELIEADPEYIKQVSGALSSATGTMDTELQGLTNLLNYLTTQWTGEAADAYQTAQIEWNSTMSNINAILLQATGILSGIATRYETTESDIVTICGA